jgi:hypothetical protein
VRWRLTPPGYLRTLPTAGCGLYSTEVADSTQQSVHTPYTVGRGLYAEGFGTVINGDNCTKRGVRTLPTRGLVSVPQAREIIHRVW